MGYFEDRTAAVVARKQSADALKAKRFEAVREWAEQRTAKADRAKVIWWQSCLPMIRNSVAHLNTILLSSQIRFELNENQPGNTALASLRLRLFVDGSVVQRVLDINIDEIGTTVVTLNIQAARTLHLPSVDSLGEDELYRLLFDFIDDAITQNDKIRQPD